MKKKYLLLLAFACNCSLLCALSGKIIFQESFQNYPYDNFPFANNWQMPYSGAGRDKQIIKEKDGNKYIHLEGASHWSANAVKELEMTPKQVYLEALIRCNNLLGAGNELMEMASIGFYNHKASTWGYIFAGVKFDWNGNIVFGQLNAPDVTNKVVGKWKPKKWYKIKIFYSPEKNTASLWIDGKLLSKDLTLPPVLGAYNAIVLKGGNGADQTSCDFDDIVVYTLLKPISLIGKTLEGEKLYEQKKYKQALEVFQEIQEFYPENIHNLGNLSITYHKLANPEKCRELAFNILKKGKAKPKEKASAYYNIALAYQGNQMAQAYYYKKSYELNSVPFLKEILDSLPNTLAYDNFDTYSSDLTFWDQSDWELTSAGKSENLQKLTSEFCISPDYSLQLIADTILPACAHRFLDISNRQLICMSVWVKTKNLAQSTKDGQETKFGFYSLSLGQYGYFFAGIKFKSDHLLYFGSSAQNMENHQLTHWKPNTWYKIEIEYNPLQDIGSVKVNGQLKAEMINLNNSYPPSANSVCLLGGNHTQTISYFDEIAVFNKKWKSNLFK